MKCPWCQQGEFGNFPSEASKYAHLVEQYMTSEKNVLDIGSGGWPVVPHAIQVELDAERFKTYTSHQERPPIQWKGDGLSLPFKDATVDVLFSSHLIEDIEAEKTLGVLLEWARVVKDDGLLIIMHPDRDIWNYCIWHRNQPPNNSHRAERLPGELSKIALKAGLITIQDDRTNLWEYDYNILSIFQIPSGYRR